ncbi:MAG: hypothetical protein U0556_05950 [Dehalococcoidia bacterium]
MNLRTLTDVEHLLDLYVEGAEDTHGVAAGADALAVAEIIRGFARLAHGRDGEQWTALLDYLNGRVPQAV